MVGVVHVCVHGHVACACMSSLAPSANVWGLRCWFSSLRRSAERREGRGNAWKLRRLPCVAAWWCDMTWASRRSVKVA